MSDNDIVNALRDKIALDEEQGNRLMAGITQGVLEIAEKMQRCRRCNIHKCSVEMFGYDFDDEKGCPYVWGRGKGKCIMQEEEYE